MKETHLTITSLHKSIKSEFETATGAVILDRQAEGLIRMYDCNVHHTFMAGAIKALNGVNGSITLFYSNRVAWFTLSVKTAFYEGSQFYCSSNRPILASIQESMMRY
ncbi:hypothetical protein HS088_TW04G00246 [Tripterygium wilfordii]|uniref:Uncharacterized protein n=1 Tax=Tripterygium wilfordii TaxID=458696 RepID=A0A7J7DQ10_TRIWF|nr:hypothetical protein HS088_TW04G00246 [Tripterygium wilfordii]